MTIPFPLLCVENTGFTSCCLCWVDKTWYSYAREDRTDYLYFYYFQPSGLAPSDFAFVYLQNSFCLVGL